MRRQRRIVGTLVAAAWLFAAPEAFAAPISAARLAGELDGFAAEAPLYAHDRTGAGLPLLGSTGDAAAAEPSSLMGIELFDVPASAAVAIGVAASEVARALNAEDAHLFPEDDRRRSAEAAAIIAVQVLPALEWKAEPVVEHDLTNIASEPIPMDSTDPNAVTGTVIIATPATAADSEVPPPLEPVVQGGVVALNLMMSAAVSLFEHFSSILHRFLFLS